MALSPSILTTTFRPLPFLRNAHVQTVLGQCLPTLKKVLPNRVQIVRTDDQDAVALHDSIPPGWQPGQRIAVIVHGLTGSHQAAGVQRLALLLLKEGVRTVLLDLRGCGVSMPLSRRSYHAGDSADLKAALLEVNRWSPGSPIVVAANSLGGNITLKLAGELGKEKLPQLRGLVAVCPPIDIARCAALIGLRRNRLYETFFLRRLMREARKRQSYFPDLDPLRFPRRMNIRLFDELYTAPRGGFRDAQDYYQQTSSAPLISRIHVPTLILTARDDPFIAIEPFEELKLPPSVTLQILPHGGHLGFLGWDGMGGLRWAEHYLVRWLLKMSE